MKISYFIRNGHTDPLSNNLELPSPTIYKNIKKRERKAKNKKRKRKQTEVIKIFYICSCVAWFYSTDILRLENGHWNSILKGFENENPKASFQSSWIINIIFLSFIYM